MSTQQHSIISGLSDEQRAAALKTDEPVMIIACAGSGKTRTLTGRVLHLIGPTWAGGLGADPSSIMMMTFTNMAAREMRQRITPEIEALREKNPKMRGEPWIGTFHGLSLRILRIEAARAGLGKNFSIFDESDAANLAKEVAETMGLDTFDVDEFFRDLELAKARLLSAELLASKHYAIELSRIQGEALPRQLETWKKILELFETPHFTRMYTAYQRALQEQNAVDFSDLMSKVTQLFKEHPDVRDSWRSSFRHFMVDESQDLNRAQIAWLDAFTDGGREMVISSSAEDNAHASAEHGLHEINAFRVRQFPRPTVAFVGDDDQSIYAFRGSDPKVMRELMARYPGMDVKFLKESYRCQPSILEVANAVVSRNTGRFEKEIKPAIADRMRAKVVIEEHRRPEDEIRRIVAEAARHIGDGGDPAQYAVLTRTRDQAKAVVRELRAAGIPVSEGKASDIRKTAEVRDAMAFAGYLTNPDADTYLKRIINKPARGLGPTSTARVQANARAKNVSFQDELRSIVQDRIDLPEGSEAYKAAFVRKVKEFDQTVADMRSAMAGAGNASAALRGILETSGYLPMMRRDALASAGLRDAEFGDLGPRDFLTALIRETSRRQDEKLEDLDGEELADRAGQLSEAGRRIGNIALLLDQAEPFSSLESFVQEATLEMNQQAATAGIKVMTVHASKGLEFDKVRLPFLIEGVFPHSRAIEEGDEAIEEERRLFYVALTRAREDVRVSRSWMVNGCPFLRLRSSRPSRFIEDITRAPRSAFELTSIKGVNNPAYRVGSFQREGHSATAEKPDVLPAQAPTRVSPAPTTVPAEKASPLLGLFGSDLPEGRRAEQEPKAKARAEGGDKTPQAETQPSLGLGGGADMPSQELGMEDRPFAPMEADEAMFLEEDPRFIDEMPEEMWDAFFGEDGHTCADRDQEPEPSF